MEQIKEGIQEEYHYVIPLQQDHCIVLESFLETAGQDLDVPETSHEFKLQPFLLSLARVSIAAEIAVSDLLSYEASRVGLNDAAEKFRELTSLSTQPALDQFSSVYNEFLKGIQQDTMRRTRVNASRAALVVICMTHLSACLSVRDQQHTQQAVVHVGTIALAFSSLAACFDKDIRQGILGRLIRARVGVVRNPVDASKVS